MSDGIDVPLNYNRITNRIFLGSRPQSEADIKLLRSDSVSHILNVCTVDEIYDWNKLGIFGYYFNPTLDDGQPKPAGWFINSLKWVMPLLTKPGAVIYVHCYNGIDRSAATVYAILCAFGLTHDEAWIMIKTHRPEALWRYMSNANTALIQGW